MLNEQNLLTLAEQLRNYQWVDLSHTLEEGISLVGCDTAAIDAFGAEENPAHYTLLGNEVYIVENMKNLDKLPPFCFFMAFPQGQGRFRLSGAGSRARSGGGLAARVGRLHPAAAFEDEVERDGDQHHQGDQNLETVPGVHPPC